MIGTLAAIAYFGSVAVAFREVTRRPVQEIRLTGAILLMIILAVVAGNIITGGE